MLSRSDREKSFSADEAQRKYQDYSHRQTNLNDGFSNLTTPLSDNLVRVSDSPYFKSEELQMPKRNLLMDELQATKKIQDVEVQKHVAKTHTTNLDYDPLAIPADWNIAVQHAQARRVAEDNNNDEVCPCCGYEINRISIGLCDSTLKLNFLGSGLPLFYNFVIYCIIILTIQFCIKGAYDLYINITGTYCLNQAINANQCPYDWESILSLANSIDPNNQMNIINVKADLDILMILMVMITLTMFRIAQKKLEVEIDASYISPGDYTVIVRNIPIGLDVDYKKEITTLMEKSVPGVPIKVTKVLLIHDGTDIKVLEGQLEKLVQQKKDLLVKIQMKFRHEEVLSLNSQIKDMQRYIFEKQVELENDDTKFRGIAFVSFQSENMKRQVCETNSYTFIDEIRCYQKDGKYTDNTLSWMGYKLLIREAPEPNGMDWSNLLVKSEDRFKGTIKSFFYSAAFMISLFLILWIVSAWKNKTVEEGQQLVASGQQLTLWQEVKITFITSLVSWIIVLFNKFLIGPMIKKFVLMEKIDTKTGFNISMAKKVTVALFINTALLVYFIEIILNANIIGEGGFIQAETSVFISTAWFTILVWVLDPWYIEKILIRNYMMKSTDTHPVTQQEANLLMEETDYSQSKRYCDVMKCMWFTFFYGDAIPVGILINILQLIAYYWIDKYNVLRRRTIKDTIQSDLSNEMVEWLEWILVFHGIGQITMTYGIYQYVPWQQYLVLVMSVIYVWLPIQEWSFRLFPIKESDETIEYDQAKWQFETDYDRENPLTRALALQRWKKEHEEKIDQGELET